MKTSIRIAVVHDWLYTYAGSERVLEQILTVFPEASLFALFDNLPDDNRAFIRGKSVCTSFLQRMPGIRRNHRWYLPLMPLAIEQFDLSRYDLIISSSHAVAKGILPRADQLHISYIHSPIRYAWDLQQAYLQASGSLGQIRNFVARPILHYLRLWDRLSADRVDTFIANSHNVRRRIWRSYRRKAYVIYPPVDVDAFRPSHPRDDFYLTVSRLVPYKRIDLIVDAFNELGLPLIVIGEGEQSKYLKSQAKQNVQILDHQPDDTVRDYLQRCKAFIFAAEEDFGIAPVEAQAAGAPVIAYGKGGARETVIEGSTGYFFQEQTVDALMAAIRHFEAQSHGLQMEVIIKNAQRFRIDRFRNEFQSFVQREWERFRAWRDSTADT